VIFQRDILEELHTPITYGIASCFSIFQKASATKVCHSFFLKILCFFYFLYSPPRSEFWNKNLRNKVITCFRGDGALQGLCVSSINAWVKQKLNRQSTSTCSRKTSIIFLVRFLQILTFYYPAVCNKGCYTVYCRREGSRGRLSSHKSPTSYPMDNNICSPGSLLWLIWNATLEAAEGFTHNEIQEANIN